MAILRCIAKSLLVTVGIFLVTFNIAVADLPRSDRVPAASLLEEFDRAAGLTNSEVPQLINELGMALIQYFEGWEPKHYDDPAGYCTIGFGHLIALKKCELVESDFKKAPLTMKGGIELLEQDTRSARSVVEDLVTVSLDENQFSAVAAFVFNVGKSKFATSTMLVLLNSGDLEAAAAQFGRWRKANGVVLPGLVQRRACERELFSGGIQLIKGRFDVSQCKSLNLTPEEGEPIDILVGE
ncbi:MULTISPECIES: lysozyme [unclassified Rhizobium]|uniref:lysozyme n=1 Tax=unclassified Rhizobium TaxID=2613769 RepID=UPI003819B0DC